MKKKISKIIMVALLAVSAEGVSPARANDVELPAISRPALLLEEGTQRTLTDAQISELLPWASNSKIVLNELLDDIKDMNINDKVNHLTQGITDVVKESTPSSELLMRYVLNRALVLQETIKKETDENAVGVIDVKLRILLSSIKMAIKYYDVDTKMMNNKSSITFAGFGANYFHFLLDINKSIFDASAQLEIHKIILEWLAWDLYRDAENKVYAPQIVKIHGFLKKIPKGELGDTEALLYIRKMRDLEEKLEVSSIAQKIIQRSPGRELKISEAVLVKSKATGLLKDGIIYANVSSSVPNNDSDNTHYCVKFTKPSKEERFMAYDNFVKRSEIFLASGCGEKFCVGQSVLEKKTRDTFTIIGIDLNGDYAIRLGEREMTGLQDKDLLKIK